MLKDTRAKFLNCGSKGLAGRVPIGGKVATLRGRPANRPKVTQQLSKSSFGPLALGMTFIFSKKYSMIVGIPRQNTLSIILLTAVW